MAQTALAVIGGVLAYMVAIRRHELGVRMALGAGRGQIVSLILGQSLRMVGFGLAVGLVGAWLLRDVLTPWLFGVGAFDPAAFGAALVILVLVAVLSALGPAWRAAWLDPVRALREE
jgi:ABC-type antimicrobial peptide transport system permease subunit